MSLETILVVDDSELIHRMFDIVLLRYRRNGATILHARNGLDALAILRSRRDVQLVLLDVNMPAMGGVDLLRELRTAGSVHRNLRIVMVSTEGFETHVQTALSLGACAYVTKPFDPAKLHAIIEREFGLPIRSGVREANGAPA